eukprot:1190343-Prorocentrum_minimum.AAC.1
MERFGDQAEAGRKGIKVGQYEYGPWGVECILAVIGTKGPLRLGRRKNYGIEGREGVAFTKALRPCASPFEDLNKHAFKKMSLSEQFDVMFGQEPPPKPKVASVVLPPPDAIVVGVS